MIKEHFEKLQCGKCSKTEVILTGICLFLLGVVLGMKIAPARFASFGSFNGNSGSIDKPEELISKFCDHKEKHDCCCHDEN